MVIPDAVRRACAEVASDCRQVHIDTNRLESYAAELAAVSEAPVWLGHRAWGDDRESVCARIVVGNAINFGSGWHPVLRKAEGLSGARTVSTALDRSVLSAAELATMNAGAVAALLGQDPNGPAGDLMGHFSSALRAIGSFVLECYEGSFASLVDAADGSALALVETLAGLPTWRDVCQYDGVEVPFWKRAQITANDLHRALGDFKSDVDRLTMFADNLIPHVLRVDGVLVLDSVLGERIGRGELLAYGEPGEVELRACAVQAVELLAGVTGRAPRILDDILWTAGQRPTYKAIPRPRCRTTAY